MKKMSLDEFKNSFSAIEPPSEITPQEKALWWAGKGEWEKAHVIVQDLNDRFSSHIHAFLHRQEGDISNARYWYNMAGEKMPAVSLDKEWELLFEGLPIDSKKDIKWKQ
jgi:hypothetical protein